MKIFLDDFIFSLQSIGGISVYWSTFLQQCQRIPSKEVALIRRGDSKSILPIEKIWKGETITEGKLPLIIARLLPLLIKLPDYSLFHSSYLRYSLQKKVCNIVTIHDLAAELGVVKSWKTGFKRFLQRSAIKHADGIICVSEATRKALLNIYPEIPVEKTKVIYHGFSNSFYRIEKKQAEPSKTILFIGARTHYKNFHVCIKAIKKLKNFKLVLIGGGQLTGSEVLALNDACEERYTHHDNLDTAELNKLYNKSFCLLYPSFYEGFGMPIIEAMKAGCPVVCAANEAVKEVANDAALMINDSSDYNDFINAIISLESEALRNTMIEKGLKKAAEYSIEKNFTETLSFYSEVYKKKFNLM